MKEGWEYKKLGDLGTFVRGGNFSKKDFVENGFPCIHYGQIHMKFGIETFKHISSVPAGMVKPDRCAHKGDLVIAITSEDDAGSCKCTAWMGDYDAYVGGHTAIYRHTMQPKYVSYYFMSPFFQKDKLEYTHGFKVVEISPKDIAKITIPVPPLSEQQSIVNYLDSAFAKIDAMKANAEKALNEAKALFQASLKEMLEPKEGWEEKTLKDVSVIHGNYGLSVPSTEFNGVRYLRITDITEWGDLNDEKVSAKLDEEKEQELLEEGDILFARTGATVGKTLMYKEAFGKCLFAGYLIRYRLNKEIVLPKFVFYITHSDNYYKWVLENQKAAAQPNISAKLYNEYNVSYPSLSEQQSIVATLDSLKSKVDRLQENYNKISQECDALKQAILRQVFE